MRTLINKIKDIIKTWLDIDLVSNKAIGNINKTIGIIRNGEIKLIEKDINSIQKDVELLMNVIEKRLPPYALNKEDDEIKALENDYALETLVHEIIDNILEVAHTNEDFNDVKEIIKKHIEHVINKDDELIKKAREEEIFNELEEESRIIKRVLKSRELERAIERSK